MNVKYRVIREELSCEDVGTYVGFGLEACLTEAGVETTALRIPDISVNQDMVRLLAERCNRLGVSLDQIYDIVEDAISYAV